MNVAFVQAVIGQYRRNGTNLFQTTNLLKKSQMFFFLRAKKESVEMEEVYVVAKKRYLKQSKLMNLSKKIGYSTEY